MHILWRTMENQICYENIIVRHALQSKKKMRVLYIYIVIFTGVYYMQRQFPSLPAGIREVSTTFCF